jgi:hypothetical protein
MNNIESALLIRQRLPLVAASIILASMGISSTAHLQEKYSGREKALVQLASFPSETDEAVLAFPQGLCLDKAGLIYILDQTQSSILVYQQDGSLVRKIGRRGMGPGEFNLPQAFCCDDERLYVSDQGNRRVQILDSTGQYIGGFNVFRSLLTINHLGNNILGQEIFDDTEVDKFRLLAKFSYHGAKLTDFGKPVNESIDLEGLPLGASSARVRIYKEKIFLLFSYYPLLRVYSKNGILLSEVKLKIKEYRNLIPGNYSLKQIFSTPNYVKLRYLFLAFDVTEDGIFVCPYKDDIEVDHFDFEGNFLSSTSFKHEADDVFYVQDLNIRRKEGISLAYVLTYLPLPKVHIFRMPQ